MSYVLHVWEAPLPQTLAEAAAAALDMGGDRIGQNPGFLVLAGRLASRYPFTPAAPNTSVWSDARLDGRTEERAWQIGVRSNHVRVISYLVVQANRLGLCVFDMQQGIAWLPNGTVLRSFEGPVVRASLPGKGYDDRLTKFEVSGGLRRLTHKMVAPLGYLFEEEPDEVSYRLTLPGGWISVVPLVWDYSPGYRYSFVFEIRHDRVADLVAGFEGATGDAKRGMRSATIHLRDVYPGIDRDFRVGSVRRLQLELESLEPLLRDLVVPLLEQCRTVEGLERFVNRPARVRTARDSGVHFAQDIAMAWLVGRADWETVGADCIAALDETRGADKLKLAQFVEYLRGADRGAHAHSAQESTE